MRRLSIIDTEPGATGPYGFCRMKGGVRQVVDCGGHLEIYNDICTIQIFAMLPSVLLLILGSLAEC